MAIRQIAVQRFSVISSQRFEDVLAKIDAGIGRPDMRSFGKDVAAASTYLELEEVIHKVIGKSGFMEFARFDLGQILRKESGKNAPKIVRIVAGNPLIMKQMVEHVSDAGSYAPITILIDERPDGVHLSYDRMASFLAPYENEQVLKVAQDLDAKVEALLLTAAG